MAGDYLNPGDGNEQPVTEGTQTTLADDAFEETDLPAPGIYDGAVCMGAEPATSKKGNAQIVLDIADPTVPGASAKYYLVNSPAAAFRFNAGIEAFGVTRADLGAAVKALKDGESEAVRRLFVGKKVTATGKHETYQGNKSFKWDALKAPVEGAGFRVFEAA